MSKTAKDAIAGNRAGPMEPSGGFARLLDALLRWRFPMTTKLWLVLTLLIAATTLSACGPLVGAAGAVAADNAAEENGDDGLF
jgi:hypothetical protein